jgi:hypothetical protein
MKYYYQPENRIITTEELVRKYGSPTPVPGLGTYELTYQPDFIPVAFALISDKKYAPIESV